MQSLEASNETGPTHIMFRYHIRIPNVNRRNQNQPRLGSLDALDRIEYLQCTFIVDLFGAIFTSFPATSGAKVDDIRAPKCLAEFGRRGVLERKQEWSSQGVFDVGFVFWVSDYGGHRVCGTEEACEAESHLK